MSYVLAGRLGNLWLLLTMVHWEEFGYPRCHSSPLLNACARSGKRTSDAKRLTYSGSKDINEQVLFSFENVLARTLRSRSFRPIIKIVHSCFDHHFG